MISGARENKNFSVITRLDINNLSYKIEVSTNLNHWGFSTNSLTQPSLAPIENGFGRAVFTGAIVFGQKKNFIRHVHTNSLILKKVLPQPPTKGIPKGLCHPNLIA
mgnify:CR=1 FL=1|jgi:hypothetical protein